MQPRIDLKRIAAGSPVAPPLPGRSAPAGAPAVGQVVCRERRQAAAGAAISAGPGVMPEPHPIELKRIAAGSRSLEHFRAALRRQGHRPWTSPFAASGAKPPPTAPRKRRT
jgi:hypothetical protein